MNELIEKLSSVFRNALNLKGTVDVSHLEYNKIQEWDSVAHMTLVAAIEDAFDIMLDTDEVIDMSSFSKALETVQKHVQA